MMFLDCPAHVDPDGTESPADPERGMRHRHGVPAYYLGRPAALYITAMRPRGRSARLVPELTPVS